MKAVRQGVYSTVKVKISVFPRFNLISFHTIISFSEDFIVDFVEVQCFLHTGMILDVSVHPDDSIFQIKQIILNSATADGKHTGRFDSPNFPILQ